MVSRLVAVRLGVPSASAAAMQALEREFATRPMSEVAAALIQGKDIQWTPAWDAPFKSSSFTELLSRDEPQSRYLLDRLQIQNSLFLEHLAARSAGADRVILCDTGLYGRTARCLEEVQQDKKWSCVLFARSNFNRRDAPHFDTTVGLSVERDYYSVFNSRTAALRFWHLFESVLEPSLPSVTTFSREWAGAEPTSNLQVRNWRDDRYWSDSPMFSAILEFIEELPSQDTASYILSEATRAWSSLAKCITFPSRIELSKIQIADRSHDFGREGKVPFISRTRPSLHSRLRSLQSSLWREGYIASSFPRSRILLLLGLEATYFIRSIWLFLTSTSGLMLSERNPTR
jgi:hypothetical protein